MINRPSLLARSWRALRSLEERMDREPREEVLSRLRRLEDEMRVLRVELWQDTSG